jgi:hypothetical protein
MEQDVVKNKIYFFLYLNFFDSDHLIILNLFTFNQNYIQIRNQVQLNFHIF